MAQKSEPKYVDIGVDRLVTASLELVRRELQDHQVSAELDLDADTRRFTATGRNCSRCWST
jgi:hypothetical protein